MKASTRTTYGSPDVITVKEVEKPTPKANEILVRVYATTVNRTDCGALWGKPFVFRFFIGLFKPRNEITGTDFAGVVEAVGQNVTSFKVGDRVWGFDDNTLPSHAEYMAIDTKKPVLKIPNGFTFEQAAASAEAAHYAYNFLNKVKLAPGMKVLVNGGTGAIGSAAIQFLKSMDIFVIAVCHSQYNDRVQALGPDRIIHYDKEDFTQDYKKYDFVFDAVGKSSFKPCTKILKDNGIYISSELGPGAENLYLPLLTSIKGGKKVIFPLPIDISKSLAYVADLAEKGKFKPLIDRTYTLDEIKEAFTYVNSGQKIGNVVIKLN
ncbi:MAG TPA: NAD(P)-dependent alcohol dehydrogenase [Cyclobacteriaceae bacterium]|nr:NAD(P)-dependent alcohol dehydrogenase [Cyclobacteriaceae bacterium]HRJ81481.1 NAD(P)-dependent alcohol dehydrogenase [Cyclobacteriaceae bacterium]